MAYRILIVEQDDRDAVRAENILAAAGYTLDIAHSFEESLSAVSLHGPDLVITSLRLGAYNGLHLVLRNRELHPDVGAIVVADPADYVQDIDSLNVPFLSKPLKREDLLKTVSGLLAGKEPRALTGQRRWPRKRTRIPATVLNADHDVIEVSYGGFRLLSRDVPMQVGSDIVVRFPTLGLSVAAVARWSKPSNGEALCGVEITDSEAMMGRWRRVVDSSH